MKIGKSELMNIQKRKTDIETELDKVKQEQDELEKKCFKLCELKNNVMIIIITSFFVFLL